MRFYLSVDINGVDFKDAYDYGVKLGIPGVIGALLGLAVGAALQEKAGDFGRTTLIYWPMWIIAGAIAGAAVWTSII
jgi:hypothetical protein